MNSFAYACHIWLARNINGKVFLCGKSGYLEEDIALGVIGAAHLAVFRLHAALCGSEERGGLISLNVHNVNVGLVHRLQHAQPRVDAQRVRLVDACM